MGCGDCGLFGSSSAGSQMAGAGTLLLSPVLVDTKFQSIQGKNSSISSGGTICAIQPLEETIIKSKKRAEQQNGEMPLVTKVNQNQHTEIQKPTIKMTSSKLYSPSDKTVPQKVLPSQAKQEQVIPPVDQGQAFLFGQTETERKIVQLNLQKPQFSVVLNKPFKPNLGVVPEKYKVASMELICEESQELNCSFNFHLQRRSPYNYMFATYISKQTIFLCGGVDFKFEYFSEQAFLFRPNGLIRDSQTAIGQNQLQKIEDMHEKRFSCMGVFYQVDDNGSVFIFGGRNNKQESVNSCQKYSVKDNKWTRIAPMHMRRSTGFALVHFKKFYVFGGFTADGKRTKKIEIYDPAHNVWELLDVKLHRGVEAGFVCSLKSNEILLMGGETNEGQLDSVISINLVEKTYQFNSRMKCARSLQKAIKYKDQIFVFGGSEVDTFQKYSSKKKWENINLKYQDYIPAKDMDLFTVASTTLHVEYFQPSRQQPPKKANVTHLFGNDDFPCIIQLQLDQKLIAFRQMAVPMSLRLRSSMGVAKLDDNRYFLCGGYSGSTVQTSSISRASYIYHSQSNTASELSKMITYKCDFAICCIANTIYVFGGKLNCQTIMKNCEKYDITTNEWRELPQLANERAAGKAIVVGDKIVIIGGKGTYQLITDVQVFDTRTEQFAIIRQQLGLKLDIESAFFTGIVRHATPVIHLFGSNSNDPKRERECHELRVLVEESEEQHQLTTNLNLQMFQFTHSFMHNKEYYFFNQKSIRRCKPVLSETSAQVLKWGEVTSVLNQVILLVLPIKQFSMSM